MTITKNGKTIKINKDETFDRRYKESKKENQKIFIRNKNIEKINSQLKRRDAKRKYNRFLIKALIILAILSGLTVALWYMTEMFMRRISEQTLVSPIANIAYAEEVKKEKVEEPTLKDKICELDWDCETAYKIAECESRFNENAVAFEPNGTISVGYFQINSIHFDRFGGIKNVLENNIAIANRIYHDRGNNFSAWTCASILGIN